MGITYDNLLKMTWREYDYISIGYSIRQEREWDRNRNIIASLFNSSGFSKKKVKPTDVMKLGHIDKVVTVDFVPIPEEKIHHMLSLMKKNN